ncbi:toxin C-terminal domain-containing protein [Streptococcus fryi]
MSPDKNRYIKGYWKGTNKLCELSSKDTKTGTYDNDLNRIGD